MRCVQSARARFWLLRRSPSGQKDAHQKKGRFFTSWTCAITLKWNKLHHCLYLATGFIGLLYLYTDAQSTMLVVQFYQCFFSLGAQDHHYSLQPLSPKSRQGRKHPVISCIHNLLMFVLHRRFALEVSRKACTSYLHSLLPRSTLWGKQSPHSVQNAEASPVH